MPLIMRRCGSFGGPVQGFSGGRCGSSRSHCASVKSPRPTQPIWDRISETSALCRHALAPELRRLRAGVDVGTFFHLLRRSTYFRHLVRPELRDLDEFQDLLREVLAAPANPDGADALGVVFELGGGGLCAAPLLNQHQVVVAAGAHGRSLL